MMIGSGCPPSEEVRFKGGDVLDRNFDTRELPRSCRLPEVETILVKNDALVPQDRGEPAVVPVGAVIANAICDASWARLFQLPMTPERARKVIASI